MMIISHIAKVLQALIRCISDEADHKQRNFDLFGPIKPFVCANKGVREYRTHGDGVTLFGAEGA